MVHIGQGCINASQIDKLTITTFIHTHKKKRFQFHVHVHVLLFKYVCVHVVFLSIGLGGVLVRGGGGMYGSEVLCRWYMWRMMC